MYLMLIGERKTRPRINVQSILLPRMISLTYIIEMRILLCLFYIHINNDRMNDVE
jgi:hypothetical protein